jgi:DNA-binding Xre family transcriptional regulator
MGISYRPLWVLLAQKRMKKTDLYAVAGISPPTLAKLSKDMPVDGKILERLCMSLKCQPGDLVEYIHEDEAEA